jgi:hypothetical protein
MKGTEDKASSSSVPIQGIIDFDGRPKKTVSGSVELQVFN